MMQLNPGPSRRNPSLVFSTPSVPLGGLRVAVFAAALLTLASCAQRPLSPVPSSDQLTFRTPEAAVSALVAAVSAGDAGRLTSIFGSAGASIASSGDPVADEAMYRFFAARAAQKQALVEAGENIRTLRIGDDDWDLPIPVRKGSKGWFFDTNAGADEILTRRIGRNELHTINVCLGYVEAQREYARRAKQALRRVEYAQKITSTPGRKDGLYWETAEGEAPSPLGPFFADAAKEGYTTRTAAEIEANAGPRPFHGYFFRILTAEAETGATGFRSYLRDGRMTAGFALVAWPAEYGASGLTTFQVNHLGIVFQKDLGPRTEEIASTMLKFAVDESWEPVPAPGESELGE
jgi:hypothetical protein